MESARESTESLLARQSKKGLHEMGIRGLGMAEEGIIISRKSQLFKITLERPWGWPTLQDLKNDFWENSLGRMGIIKFKFRDWEGMLIKKQKQKESLIKYIYLKRGREVDSFADCIIWMGER